ncbi:MAG: ACT domain-containing protein [Oscillospiraceae bacterium]|nr:ACT domain-containing protein [Oscillospiraceae bacterium]
MKTTIMELQIIDGDFSVCRLDSIEQVDFSRELLFFAKTPDELSLVCESAHVPVKAINVESDWKMLKVSGTLDFGLVGVVSKISGILAAAEISIFVVSTFNTDYILLKSDSFNKGLKVLSQGGYIIIPSINPQQQSSAH